MRHKTRRRQVTGIPPTLVMMVAASPITITDDPAVTMPPAPVETKLEPLVPEIVLAL